MTIIFLFEPRIFLDSMIRHISLKSQNILDSNLRLNYELFEIQILNKHLLFYNVRISLFKKCIDQFIYLFLFIKILV